MRHFLDLKDFLTDDLQAMLDDGLRMKAAQKSGEGHAMPLAGKTVAMIFEKPSTRTRVSFEVGVVQLGGTPLILSANDLQLGRGESVEDLGPGGLRSPVPLAVVGGEDRLAFWCGGFRTDPWCRRGLRFADGRV